MTRATHLKPYQVLPTITALLHDRPELADLGVGDVLHQGVTG